MTVQYPRKGVTGNPQHLRCLGNAQARGSGQFCLTLRPVWGGFFMGMVSPSSSVVIDEINVAHVAIFKPNQWPMVA